MPRDPFHGQIVYNRHLRRNMHAIAEYYRGGKIKEAIYSDLIHVVAKMCKARINEGYQNIVGFVGRPGSGKSTGAIRLALELDPEWDIERNYVYSVDDLRKVLQDGPSKRILLLDEASIILNSQNSRKSDDSQIVTLFDTLRSFRWTVILAVPALKSLNKRIRDFHLDFLLACPERSLIPGYDRRGQVELYLPRRGTFADDTYWEYSGAGIYSPLPEEIDDVYQPIKREHQLAYLTKFLKNGSKGDEE